MLDFITIRIDFLELLGKVRKTLEEFLDHDNSEHKSLAVPSERFNHEFQCNSLEDVVKQLILDDSPKELSYFLKIKLWVFVEESVLIKETMEDASINFLLLHNL